jgi:predicted amidohydrolase
MKIALISMNQLWEDKARNFLICKKYVQKAADAEADLVIFPEMTLTGFSMNIAETSEDEADSHTIRDFSKLAIEYDIDIVFGAVFKGLDKKSNNLIYMSSNGNIKTVYKKIHPFSYAGEDNYFEGSSEVTSIERHGMKFGFAICYDLRFPELFTAQNENDCIILIANWPKKRLHHWQTLLTARAIENQIYIVGVNRTGKDSNGIEYEKSSCIVHPYGKTISPLATDKDMQIFEISADEVAKNRDEFRFLQDRKVDIYKKLL